MPEQKKRDEVYKILTMIYFEWGKDVTEQMVGYWAGNLHGMSREFVWKVAREMVKRKTYGEPKFQDFWQLAIELSERKALNTYNPWCSEPAKNRLTDLPGNMVEHVESGAVDNFLLPPTKEGRRQITEQEKKWIGYINPKEMH